MFKTEYTVKKKRLIQAVLVSLALIIAAGLIFSDPLLNGISQALAYKDPLVPSGAIVVLGGSRTGNRLRAAADLYRAGYGRKLVFSGIEIYPGTYTQDLIKTYALQLGLPEADIISAPIKGEVSTRGESIANLNLLRDHRIHDFILVTSAYHTMRSYLIYKKTIAHQGSNMEFRVHPAPDPLAPIDGWWRLRTGQKSIFLEYIKLAAYLFNL